MGPDELLQALEAEGMQGSLPRRWEQVEALHNEGRFTLAQIAQLFSRCGGVFSKDVNKRRTYGGGGQAQLPLSVRLVQLFSNFVCEHIPELTPDQITIFAVSLTAAPCAMDEFWLFMLAKQIQDTTSSYTAAQIVTIARRYADKELEDADFFAALSKRVVGSLQEFSLPQQADFLLSCAKLKFLDDELCAAALPPFSDPSQVVGLSGECLGAVLSAASELNQRDFSPTACCSQLATMPLELRRAVHSSDLVRGVALAAAQLHRPAGIMALLPQLLQCLSASYTGHRSMSRSMSVRVSAVKRRVALLGLCAAFGLPQWSTWKLPLLRGVSRTWQALTQAEGNGGPDLWEPTPSSFHLEVVAVLRILDVEHELEHPQSPFCLDVKISPAQLEAGRASPSWAAAASSQ